MPAKPVDLPPRLIAAPYAAPRCRPGRPLACLLHGEVPVDGMTGAPIPWPYTRYRGEGVPKSGKPMVIVTAELARAVRTESLTAVAHHWGVALSTVYLWRQALGVGRMTAGSRALLVAHAHAKLTKLASKVAAIREGIEAGKTNQQIGRELDVRWQSVRLIRIGATFAEEQPS